jgi:hypothetical protein
MCELKTVNIKGKEYVEVNERIKAFRKLEQYKGYSLESEIVELNNGVITIKAIIRDNNGVIKATGLAQEKESSSFINKTSFVENCETSAWGRALGNLGIGIDTSVASAEEVQNAIENQKPKSTPKPPAKPKEQTDEQLINDLDLIQGLQATDTIKNLNAYYKKYADVVNDLDAFQLAYKGHRATLEEQK